MSKYKDQILKDIEILNNDLTNGQIKMVEWHCFDETEIDVINNFVEQNLRNELKGKNLFKIIKH